MWVAWRAGGRVGYDKDRTTFLHADGRGPLFLGTR